MIKIYLVRHCEATGNKMKTFQGLIDCDITELGEKQLEFLSARFHSIHIDKAYSGPLKRAFKTALAAIKGKGLVVTKEPLFTEINGGDIEGMPFEELFKSHPYAEDAWDNHPEDFCAPNGEPMQKVYDRMKKGLEKLINDPENYGKTILIASHGAAIRCLICHIIYNSIGRLKETPWSVNTAVSLITYNNSSFEVEFLNDDSHLPDEFKSQKSRLLVKEK